MSGEITGNYQYISTGGDSKSISGTWSGKTIYCDKADLEITQERCQSEFKDKFVESMLKHEISFSDFVSAWCITPKPCPDCVDDEHVKKYLEEKTEEGAHSVNEEIKYSAASATHPLGTVVFSILTWYW